MKVTTNKENWKENTSGIMKMRELEVFRGIKVLSSTEKNHNGNPCEVIDCRLYSGRSKNSSVIKCAIWVHYKDFHFVMTGNAGGYGYEKQSAAIEDAFIYSGIKTDLQFGGVGLDAAKDALLALARKITGLKSLFVVEFYG